ncbi:DUF6571 family protein [Haloactinomyces albus]|uniref:DUF6571 domain-containing protein n=1 Tax=Haloactinomyces albus TaxID=1352928 RepID=A0AAE3ZG14_9ACTN|nr:DUF6571 family protein [Haloactinomyces albus]MDR7304202.1 hypothetical protein [Haloactinomyces albus]
MDYSMLMAAQPALLRRAGEAWKKLARDFDEQITDFQCSVCNTLELDGIWKGKAAQAACKHVEHIRKEMEKYRDDLQPAGPGLITAAEDIDTCQQQLQAVDNEINDRDKDEWSISNDGKISYPAGAEAQYQSYVAEIEGIIGKAAKADQAAARAAEAADVAYANLKQVLTEERREEEQAAGRAAKLASQPPDELSFDEAKRLARLLRNHGDDPAFAGEFLEDVPPEELLRLSQQVGSTGFGWGFHGEGQGPNKLDVLKSLQSELGETLATGTSAEGREYLGRDVHNDSGLDSRAGEYADRLMAAAQASGDEGYRAVGTLLHSGEYSAEFLNPVGDALIAADRADPFEGTVDDLNYVDEHGKGGDPLVGLMVAMDNNPEAADDFFDPERNPETLPYLLERDWPADFDERGGYPDHAPQASEQAQKLGQNMLGEALEAATLEGEYRSEAAARVMSGTVHELATSEQSNRDPSGGAVPPPMRDSIGHMISGYMGDVHGASEDSAQSYNLSVDDPQWAHSENGINHARFNQAELYQVMGSAAYDPDAYAEMRNANMVYTELKLNEIATDETQSLENRRMNMADVAQQSSTVLGALDEARTYAVDEFYDGKDAAYNSAINAGGVLTTAAVAGGGAALGGVGGALVGAAGAETVKSAVGALQQDSSHIVAQETSELQASGRKDASALLAQSLWEHEMWKDSAPPPPIAPGEEELGNHPNRIFESDGSLPGKYNRWVSDNNPYGDGVDHFEVGQGYDTGANVYADATGNRPVPVSETK